MSKNSAIGSGKFSTGTLNKLRRLCQVEGCTRVVKSQGLCQRHGAKTILCKVPGCTKQAQGGFGRMCKNHYNTLAFSPEDHHLQSFYDHQNNDQLQQRLKDNISENDDQIAIDVGTATTTTETDIEADIISVYDIVIPSTISWSYQSSTCMPLGSYLKQGYSNKLPPGWHRNLERKARQLVPVCDLSLPFETWEIDLIWIEIGLLTGFSDASFVQLSYAWGREPGFHYSIARTLCESRGTKRKTMLASESRNHQQTNIESNKRKMPMANTDYTNKSRLTTVPTSMSTFASYGRHDHNITGHLDATIANSFFFADSSHNLHCQPVQQQHQYQDRRLQQQLAELKETDETQESLKESYEAFEKEILNNK